jgi:YjbE family integral membrane protein
MAGAPQAPGRFLLEGVLTMFEILSSISWVAVAEIIAIDILLGGDNAVVIALACRDLPQAQRKLGILWGTLGAIVLRVVLIFFALSLLQLPGLKLAGAALLLWIGVKLLVAEDQEGHGDVKSSDRLWGAVKTVIVADFVMSLDNVIAIAGAAETAAPDQQLPLVIFGLLASIPIIVWGSQLVLKLMDRFPAIITAGGMLLGWIAGTMAISDPIVADPAQWTWAPKIPQSDKLRWLVGGIGALLVLVTGKWLASRQKPAGA